MEIIDSLLGKDDVTEDFNVEEGVLRYNLEDSVTEGLGSSRKRKVRSALESYLEDIAEAGNPVAAVELAEGDESLAFYRHMDPSGDTVDLEPDNWVSGSSGVSYPASEYAAIEVANDVERYFNGEDLLGGVVPERDGYPEDLE